MTFNYKKYSLENLENWMHDAMSSAEATPQEIYDVIKGVVEENYYHHKDQTSKAYELLTLLNSNSGQSYEDVLKERDYYESSMTEEELSQYKVPLSCDKDDSTEECKKSWTSFWEENYYPDDTVSSVKYTDEELEAMCDKAKLIEDLKKIKENGGYEWTPNSNEKVKKKWVLPVDVDSVSGEYYVTFPQDLLKSVNLSEGDVLDWVDNKDGTWTFKKVDD